VSAVRQAPPVSVVCRGRGWRVVQSLLYAAAAASSFAWMLQRLGLFDALGLAAAATLVAALAGALAWRLLRSEPSSLRWDGQQWTLGADPMVLAVMLDGAGLLLLRATDAQGRTRWLAVSRGDAGQAWHALRVAAYARVRQSTRPGHGLDAAV
jgi:hypothetical protein